MLTPAIPSLDLIDIDRVIDSYDYETDPILKKHFRPIEDMLWSAIEHYGAGVNDIGLQFAGHLRRTSLDGMKFLIDELGFSERAGRNFHAANLFQDLGKIHPAFDPMIWNLPHRPTNEERAEKLKHTTRGPEVLAAALDHAHAPEDLRRHPHIAIVIPAIQTFHHERVNGTGAFGRKGTEMGQVIKAVCIVDAKDGDMIQRGHHSLRRNEKEALMRLRTAEKYQGAFDDMLDRYIYYRERVAS